MKDMIYMLKKYPIRGALILIALLCAVLLNLFPILLADYSVRSTQVDTMISSSTAIDDAEVPLGNIFNYYGSNENYKE